MLYRDLKVGDEVFIRARLLSACSDAFQVRIEDFPSISITAWAPISEVAVFQDIPFLRRPRRGPL